MSRYAPMLFCLLGILGLRNAAAELDDRLTNTFYLDGERQTFVLVIRDDKFFEVLGPDGRKSAGKINATKREIGFTGTTNRHFSYGFEGDNLLLMPTEKDTPGAGEPLGVMPPRRDNETLKFIAQNTWLKTHPVVVVAPPPVAVAAGSGAGGGAGLESLLEIERTRGKAAAQNEAEFRLYMAAGDREFFAGRLDEARKQYEFAQRFKPEDHEARRRLLEIAQRPGLGPVVVEVPAGGERGGRSEERILELVRDGRLDDAQRAAADHLAANPNSSHAAKLKNGVDLAAAVERLSAGVQGVGQRARRAAQEVLGFDPNDGAARRVTDSAAAQEALAVKAPGIARRRLLDRDYDGVASVLTDERTSARSLADECDAASNKYTKRAEDAGEFKGLKIGDVKILGVDSETKKQRRWTDAAETFRALGKEAGDLAR
ncbi:MAG: hypothetical protein HY291_03200 [Planctomycetes bacterium]|nr:hypothetical protein [Planctomycetota bacterium]